jgi:uncharacterized protein
MSRPRRFRRILQEPDCAYFKPWGVGLCELDETQLKFEELEALRLKDFKGMDQVDAAKKMDVSQPTFHRILGEARKKVATALVKGMAIKIYGGRYKMPQGNGTCPKGKGQKTGRFGEDYGFGPSGNCVCPKCGYKEVKIRATPCFKIKCPKCNTNMARET